MIHTLPDKIIQLEPTFELTDEPRVVAFDPWSRQGMYKHASEDALDYCRAVQPKPGKRYVLVLGLSASEYYGPNRNGDAFAEREVVGPGGKILVKASETLPRHHQSFERGAHIFAHHVNKDPRKGYGKPVKSFYNWKMHRVEIVLEIDLEKANGQFFIDRIDKGESPGVSMGCRIPYDVCAICGNHAPTRAQYCEHVNNKDPRFGMNQLTPEGLRCFVWNPSPDFFDISFVWRPADPIGFMMKKVASQPYTVQGSREVAERIVSLQNKRAALGKISAIDKVIQGEMLTPSMSAEDAVSPESVRTFFQQASKIPGTFDDMPHKLVVQIAHLPLPVITSSMMAADIVPTARDIFKIIAAQRGQRATPEMLDLVGKTQGAIAEALKDAPEVLEAITKQAAAAISSDYVVPELTEKIAQEMPGRPLYLDALLREHVPESIGMPLGTALGADPTQAYYGSTMQPLTYRDPSSGKRYMTNRRAAEQADLENKKKLVAEGAGVAAGLGLGYKALTAGSKHRRIKNILAPAALGTAGVLGYDLMKGQRVPRVRTEQGEYVPANTEFVEKRSSRVLLPLGGGAATTLAVSQDAFGKIPLEEAREAQQIAANNPTASTLGSATVLAAGQEFAPDVRDNVRQAVRALTKRASHDSLGETETPIEAVIAVIGQVLSDYV